MPKAARCRSTQGNEDDGRETLDDTLKFGPSRFKSLNTSGTSIMDSLPVYYFTTYVTSCSHATS